MVEKKEPFDEKCRRLGLFDKSLEKIIDMIAEKDREIERLNEQLAEKDNEISDLKMGDELYRKWVEDTQKWLMR